MADVARLQVEVDSRPVKKGSDNLNKFSRSANKAERETKQFGGAAKKTTRSVDKMNTTLRTAGRVLGAVGITVGVQQLASFTDATLQSTLQIERQSKALGVSAQRFQELQFTFSQFGSDTSDIADVLNTLADRSQDAVQGMQSFIDDFALVGIEVDQLRGKRPVELFELFASAISSIDDPTRRNAAAVRILGDDIGNRLLPLLQEGTEGLSEYASEARSVGAVLQDDLVANGAEAAKTFQIVKSQINAESARAIAANAEGLAALAEAVGAVAEAFIRLGGAVGDILSFYDSAIEFALDPLTKLTNALMGVEDAAGKAAQGASKAAGDAQPKVIEGPEKLPNVRLINDMQFVGNLNKEFEGIDLSVQQIVNNLPLFDTMMLSIGESVRDVSDTMETGIGNALEDLIVRGEEAKDVFKQLAAEISTAILRQQVIDPAASAITSAIGGLFPGGGQSGGQAATTAQMSNMSFIPQNANGGNVFGGSPSIVGERGPELFVPSQDGQIVPNHRMGGGGDVTVNIINQGGEQLQAEQQQSRRGPNGEMTVDVMVKPSIERLDGQGQLDGVFRRHGAARQGQF